MLTCKLSKQMFILWLVFFLFENLVLIPVKMPVVARAPTLYYFNVAAVWTLYTVIAFMFMFICLLRSLFSCLLFWDDVIWFDFDY